MQLWQKSSQKKGSPATLHGSCSTIERAHPLEYLEHAGCADCGWPWQQAQRGLALPEEEEKKRKKERKKEKEKKELKNQGMMRSKKHKLIIFKVNNIVKYINHILKSCQTFCSWRL